MSKSSPNFHESYVRKENVTTLSEKSFGLTGGTILLCIGIIKFAFSAGWISFALAACGIIMIATAFFAPTLLSPLKTGMLWVAPKIARVLNPVLLALLYGFCFIPGGLIMRIFKHDPLQRSKDTGAATYWQAREDHPLPQPMTHQF